MAVCEERGFPAFSDAPPRRPPFTMAERSKICALTGAGKLAYARYEKVVGCWVLAMGAG